VSITPDGNGDISIDAAEGIATSVSTGINNTAATQAVVTFDDSTSQDTDDTTSSGGGGAIGYLISLLMLLRGWSVFRRSTGKIKE
ncbi:hypothetical protein ACFL2V_19975, partial [Pseudomonadota bacterium]